MNFYFYNLYGGIVVLVVALTTSSYPVCLIFCVLHSCKILEEIGSLNRLHDLVLI